MATPGTSSAQGNSIEVTVDDGSGGESLEFSGTFVVGRGVDCELRIQNEFVSRRHAEVVREGSGWRMRDLNSSNGLYWRGKRVESVLISDQEAVRLGIDGPQLNFRVRVPLPPQPPPVAVRAAQISRNSIPAKEDALVAHYAERYFKPLAEGEVVGEHTMYVRRAFAQVEEKHQQDKRRQRTVYLGAMGVLGLIALAVSLYSYHLHREALRQREVAHNLFYAMKSLDVEIAEAERVALTVDKQHGEEAVNRFESRRRSMQANYDQFLSTLHIYDSHTSEQHRLILRVARIFGECELDMPPDFEQEVKKYIHYWQSTGRFARDIRVAQEKGYTSRISQTLLDRGLPVQFFYLAMQESDFDPYRSGPMTRKGFAKGMWQFIPETAVKYGLHLGPLVDLSRPDPADQRDQADKATDAASRYIETLYGTDAQASGLLVMACYNWGEDQVLPLVRSMPPNPRERNFWRLLAEHRNQIPKETYDYVFYIISAAVIGENPRLFGFNFDNPLSQPL